MRAMLIAVLALAASPAAAEPIGENPPTRTIQCIEVSGDTIPALCHVPASRLDKRENICTCPAGGQRVEVPICGKGEAAPAESRALNVARRAAVRDGTLMGDTFQGRRICVPPRDS